MKIKVFMLIFFIWMNFLYGSSSKFVNNGAQVLDFDTGAREKSLGGAFVGAADEPNTIFYNPAGLANLQKLNISISHFALFQELSIQSLAANYPLSYGNIGVGINYFHTGDFAQIINGEITANKIFYSSIASVAGYGVSFTRAFQAGVGIKFVYNNIANIIGKALAVDAGILYGRELFKFYNKVENNFKIGLAAQNFGTTIKYISKSEKLPQKLRLGIYYKPVNYIATTFEGNYWLGYDLKDAIVFKTGIEILPEYFITPRMGLTIDNNNLEFSAGLGVGLKMSSYMYKFNMSYVGNNFLGSSLYFTLTLSPELIYLYRKPIVLNSNYIPDFSETKITKKSFLFNNSVPFKIKVLISSVFVSDPELKNMADDLFKIFKQDIQTPYIITESTSPEISIGLTLTKKKNKYRVACSIIDIKKNKLIKEIKIKFKSKKSIGKLSKLLSGKIQSVLRVNYFTTLRVSTTPETAEIYLNDKLIGKTPIVKKIKREKYNLMAKLQGFKSFNKKISLFENNNFEFLLQRIYSRLDDFDIKFTTSSTNENELSQIEALKFMIQDALKDNMALSFNKKNIPDLVFSTKFDEGILITIKDMHQNKTVLSNNYKLNNNNDYILITDKIKIFLTQYVKTIKEKYTKIYKKYKDGYIKVFCINEHWKYKILQFNEIYKNNKILKLRQGIYDVAILNTENKTIYKQRVKIEPEKTNIINYIPKYYDSFTKPNFSFWEKNNYFKKNFLYKNRLIIKSSKPGKRIILNSKKLVVKPFVCKTKFKIRAGKSFYFVISDKNENVFIKYNKKGYFFVKRKIGEDKNITGTLLTRYGNENKIYHSMKIEFKNNKIIGYIDDIKIDEYEFIPEKYMNIKFIGFGRKFSGELKDFHFEME